MSRHFFVFGGSSGFALQTPRPAPTSARAGREGLLHGHLLLVVDVAEEVLGVLVLRPAEPRAARAARGGAARRDHDSPSAPTSTPSARDDRRRWRTRRSSTPASKCPPPGSHSVRYATAQALFRAESQLRKSRRCSDTAISARRSGPSASWSTRSAMSRSNGSSASALCSVACPRLLH